LMEFNTLLHIDEIKQVCNVCSVWWLL
jgi:hypothetical protein